MSNMSLHCVPPPPPPSAQLASPHPTVLLSLFLQSCRALGGMWCPGHWRYFHWLATGPWMVGQLQGTHIQYIYTYIYLYTYICLYTYMCSVQMHSTIHNLSSLYAHTMHYILHRTILCDPSIGAHMPCIVLCMCINATHGHVCWYVCTVVSHASLCLPHLLLLCNTREHRG